MELEFHNIRFIPCMHRRVGFAQEVRRVALEWAPDAIAVELPAPLESWLVRGVARLPQVSAVCWEEPAQPGALQYIPLDPCDALIEAMRLGQTHQIDVHLIDPLLPAAPETEPPRRLPDDMALEACGMEAFAQRLGPLVRTAPDDAAAQVREDHMAGRLRELSTHYQRVLCVLGMAHWPGVWERLAAPQPSAAGGDAQAQPPQPEILPNPNAPAAVTLSHVHPSALIEVLGEVPYVTWCYEDTREEEELTGQRAFDKLRAVQKIYRLAQTAYTATYGATLNLTQWKSLLQFTRNLALVAGRIRPDFYELVVAARGIIDGDYGYEVYELARSYPPQARRPQDQLPVLHVRQGRGWLSGQQAKWRMEQYDCPASPSEMVQLRFRRRPPHYLMQQWQRQWNEQGPHQGICSWPPEDDVQERFMDYLRKRALQTVSEDRRQVEPFSTTFLDGLDIRETTRNWHTGQLYVHSTPQPAGRVGAVVLIFEDQPLEPEVGWRCTLYAEHQNESDISFFADPLGQHVVGPRICRTRFGGILSVYPAWGIPDIWRFDIDPRIQTCGQALLMAALLFSPERFIAYVAAKPPSAGMKAMAARWERHIIYMPLHTFSPAHLKKIQHFHILDGHDVRAWARDYIFED